MAEDLLEIHQALYGYHRGHRLLGSSLPLDQRTQRLLRAVTDTAFDGRSQQYLTILPLAEAGHQAFARTWPAGPESRPGSVWSHVLLLSFADLSSLASLDPLLDLFQRPSDDQPEPGAAYSAVLRASIGDNLPVARRINERVARTVLGGLYGSARQLALSSADPAMDEDTLIAVWEQQWPRLRRTSSLRTRRRVSDQSTVPFDVELVERLGRQTAGTPEVKERWLDILLADLLAPNPRFREFLQRYGSESRQGRKDMIGLVRVADRIDHGTPPEALEALCTAYPEPAEMRLLKRSLVGSPRVRSGPLAWAPSEPMRIGLLLHSDLECFDLADLEVLDRVGQAWQRWPSSMVAALSDLPLDRLSTDLRAQLVAIAAKNAPLGDLVDLAERDVGFGELVLRSRPDLLGTPALWNGDADMRAVVLDILTEAPGHTRALTFARLVERGEADAAASVCAQDPTIWWFALLDVQNGPLRSDELEQLARTLGAVLTVVGPAAVGTARDAPLNQYGLQLVALAAEPALGLWRQFSTSQWIETIDATRSSSALSRGRVLTIALLSGIDGQPALRRRAWQQTVWSLHDLLANEALDDASWGELSKRLPPGPEWDRCRRLRIGAAQSVRRDKWPAADVDQLLAGHEQWRPELVEIITADPPKKRKKKSWWRDVADHLLP